MKNTTLAGLPCWCPITIAFILLNLPVPLRASSPFQFAAEHRITGTVTDQEDLPLAGVNIIIKDRGAGTMSDENGKYTIAVQDTDILVFSYVGFKKVEIPVDGQEVLNVQLEEDVAALDEVVVNAGYYTVKERERTGNISRITAEDIEKQPVGNVLSASIGRMPGVNIQQNTGVPGGSFTIRIRGQNSLREEGNEPLYIVDGVPFPGTSIGAGDINTLITGGGNPLNSISPSDVESIEILKDADATAIYGSRGANGVVLITTKKGRAGKTRVEIDLSQSIGQVNHRMKLLNTEQYLAMRREAFANDGAVPTTANAPDLLLWEQDRYTDWQKKLIGGTSYTTNGQLSVSGGNENTRFLIRGAHYRQTPVFPGDYVYKRNSGHAQVSHVSANRNFRITLSVNYSTDKNDLPTDDPTLQALTLPPNAPEVLNDDGSLNWVGTSFNNPFARFWRKYRAGADNLVGNAVWSYQVAKGIQLKANLGYTAMQVKEMQVSPKNSFNPAFNVLSGISVFSDNTQKTWIAEPQLSYEKDVGKGKLSLLAGATFQQSLSEGTRVRAEGFSGDDLLENVGAASETTINSGYTKYRYQAVFGRIHFNWAGKYLINLTARRDGSSRFGPGKRFAGFGAIGMAWIFSEESFVKTRLPFLSFGKLRGSYGTTGNDQIGDYGFLNTWNTTVPYQGVIGLTSARLFNPEFAWETNRKTEAALELGFFQDRLFMTVSHYRNRSSNQLIGLPLPFTTGFSGVSGNLPATVQNTGWETELDITPVSGQHFRWNTAFNITIPRNKLVAFPGIERSAFANRYAVGRSLFVQKVYRFTGVDPNTGISRFEDINGDGVISSSEDRQFLVDATQRFYGGINNSFQYKNWQADVFCQFVKQVSANYISGFSSGAPGSLSNWPGEVLNRWQRKGQQTEIQKFTQGGGPELRAYGTLRGSDQSFEDTSFLRLKNVNIAYTLTKEQVEKTGLEHLTLYIRAQNLLTISGYRGLDPETQSFGNIPPLRTVTLGAELAF